MSEFVLYGFWRSSCSARLRICLNLQGVKYTAISVDLLNGEHQSAQHQKLNPSGTVPVLHHSTSTGVHKIGQSVAAMEYLNEVFQDALLPPASDITGRTFVRVLTNIIACDNQPVTNVKILKWVTALGGDAEQWTRGLMEETLKAYESTASRMAGAYSYGDSVTMADACLAPAIWNARRFRVDLRPYPTIKKIMDNLEKLDAVTRAHPLAQPDTPAEFKE